jgi:hypothetical protein
VWSLRKAAQAKRSENGLGHIGKEWAQQDEYRSSVASLGEHVGRQSGN